jgi:hypothetical protein
MVLSLFIFHFRPSYAQGNYLQDFQRLSERTIMGTARYVGMSGAMSAIGGDPSAALDNPAGLGLYRHSEALISFDYMHGITRQKDATLKGRTGLFMVPQASLVFSFPTPTENGKGVQSHTLMFAYNRVHSYSRLYDLAGQDNPSLGSVLDMYKCSLEIPYNPYLYNQTNTLVLRESGYVNEYAVDWAINVSNRFYWGVGLHIHSFVFSNEASYHETFAELDATGKNRCNANITSLFFSGADCALSTGFLYRPASWVRLGFGIQTPSVGAFNLITTGKFEARTDTMRIAPTWEDRGRVPDYHQPLHTSTSVAFQFGYYGILAFQYDYRHTPRAYDVHSLRTGLEVIPVAGLYINAGYAYESMFRKEYTPVPIDKEFIRQDAYFQYPQWSQYVSAGIGYRGSNFVAQLAYQYRWQSVNVYAHENAMNYPYAVHTDTHRVVLTIGWHR